MAGFSCVRLVFHVPSCLFALYTFMPEMNMIYTSRWHCIGMIGARTKLRRHSSLRPRFVFQVRAMHDHL
jgi:hypothetical protein